MDNDFVEFYINKCTAEIQAFVKFIEEKLASLPKDESNHSKSESNTNNFYDESIMLIEQLEKIVGDSVKEYFDRFRKEIENIFSSGSERSNDNFQSIKTRKFIQ